MDHVEPLGRAGRNPRAHWPQRGGQDHAGEPDLGPAAPDAGRIVLGGQDLTHLPMHRRVALGLSRCFQVTRIFPNESVRDNLVLAVQAPQRLQLSLLAAPLQRAWLVRTR